jgi:hypothetical protein
VTRFLEGLIARALEARPTAAPPPKPRLLAPFAAEPAPPGPPQAPALAAPRARDPARPARPPFTHGRVDPQSAAPPSPPAPPMPAGQAERPRETIAAAEVEIPLAAARAEPGRPPAVVETDEAAVVEPSPPAAAETVGRPFETAVARIFAPERHLAATAPPAPAPPPGAVTSIVIGRVELTAAPAAAPRRPAPPTRAPMSLDEYLTRRGQGGR